MCATIVSMRGAVHVLKIVAQTLAASCARWCPAQYYGTLCRGRNGILPLGGKKHSLVWPKD